MDKTNSQRKLLLSLRNCSARRGGIVSEEIDYGDLDCWSKLEAVISRSDRILLYGVAGTGKTYQANRLGLRKGQGTYNITLTSDSTATELMGHYIATRMVVFVGKMVMVLVLLKKVRG